MGRVQTGLERFVENPTRWIPECRIGLLCNPASVNRGFIHARLLIDESYPGGLAALYAPQHGFFSEKQDNMIESSDMIDPVLGIPVFSLYDTTRIPTREMFDPIDALIIDLQDAGTRVYTFASTLSYCLEAAKALGKKVVVLDRPNPINGRTVEGNCLSPDCASFVGRYAIAMRHGLTIGELAVLFNDHFAIDADLTVVPMDGWKRDMYYGDTGLPWVAPSPNLPTAASAMVYPGQVLWEGTHVSEGRGTTQPFELFGAPYFDTGKMRETLEPSLLAGVHLRPVVFEPTSGKWCNQGCVGFQIHVTDRETFDPYRLTLGLLQETMRHHPDAFQWKQPPYEYEVHRMPIDLLIGDRDIRKRLENFDPITRIEESWKD
ncbi:MAG: DUF1343 domain-containing protein, partial [Desulfobacterales bacterium]